MWMVILFVVLAALQLAVVLRLTSTTLVKMNKLLADIGSEISELRRLEDDIAEKDCNADEKIMALHEATLLFDCGARAEAVELLQHFDIRVKQRA